MARALVRSAALLIALTLFPSLSSAVPVSIGYISWDVNIPGSAGTFDISNQTGPNSSTFPDPTWPSMTPVTLSSLALGVDFVGGGHTDFGPAYFTLGLDGLSFDGGVIPIGGANPLPTTATLTGTFSPSLLALNDGSSESILSTFSATIPLNGAGLADGDFAIIEALPGITGPPAVPEPASFILLASGVVGLFLKRRLDA